MRIKTLVALYFWILEFDDVTCIRAILTTGNDSPILVYYVLVTFSDLEEQKHQKLSIKTQHWRVRQH